MTATLAPPVELPADRVSRLLRLNRVVGVAHLGQALVMLALSNDFTLPITAAYLDGDPVLVDGPPAAQVVFDLPIGPAVAVFLLLAAADHLAVTIPPLRENYLGGLARRRNLFRWVEYSASASVMLVLIAMLAGIWDLAALLCLVAANSAMILFGWLQEVDHEPGGSMTPFWFGTVVGLVPWVAIGAYLFAGADNPPGFVYGIFASLFVLFSTFGATQWLQYRRVGRWRDYLHGEATYIWLSLVAKSLLAWQVFANVLRS